MHLVVAVKHEVELPAVLPAMLAPKQTAQGFTASFAATHSDIPPKPSARFNGHPEEEQPHSPQHSNQPKDDQVFNKKCFNIFPLFPDFLIILKPCLYSLCISKKKLVSPPG